MSDSELPKEQLSGVSTLPAAVPASGEEPAPLQTNRSIISAARLVSFTLVCCLLYWGKVVAIPVALALLCSFILNPVVKRMQRVIGRGAAVAVTMILTCAGLGTLTWIIGSQLVSLSYDLPRYETNIASKIKDLRQLMRGGAIDKVQNTMENVAQQVTSAEESEAAENKTGEEAPPGTPAPKPEAKPETAPAPAASEKPMPVYMTSKRSLFDFQEFTQFLPALDPLLTAGLVLLLVVLMLLRWRDMRSRLISFSGHKNLTVATRASDDAGRRMTRYLSMLMLVNGSYGITVALGLWLLGVPYAPLWGLCATLFRFIPYVGPTAGALIPIAFSFITSDGWTQPLWVAGFFLVLELVSNNVIEPWLYGSNLGLSEMGIIISAVAWTFLWGPAGLVLATPLTVCLVVLGEYVPAFAIFTRLLGDKPVMEPHFQFYQRLLARDETEAGVIAKSYTGEHDLKETVDGLLVPALALAKRDDTSSLLDREDALFVTASVERIFANLVLQHDAAAEKKEAKENSEEPPAEPPTLKAAPVLIWPVNEFAAAAGRLLEWSLRGSAADIILLGPRSMASEVSRQISEHKPAVVCLLSLAGSEVARTRSLARRLRTDQPSTPLIVARLGVAETLTTDIRDTFRKAGAESVTRTLRETGSALMPFAVNAAQSIPA